MTNDFIDDILVTCFEGGSNYWIEGIKTVKDIPGTRYMSEIVAQDGEVDIYVDEDDKVYRLTRPAIVKGIHEALSGAAIKDGEYDAVDADCALQYALFGEVVYG